MNTNLKALASLVLVSALAGAHAEAPSAAPDPAPKTSRKHHAKVVHSTRPSVESQIKSLRSDLSAQKTQIDTLQQQLTASQQQLTQAQQSAQSAMEQAQSALSTQQAAISQNTQSVNTLQGAVTDLTANNASLASTVQADQAATKKAIEHPSEVHYKDVGLNFTNSFIEFATVNRTRATGSDINLPFLSIPLTAADAGQLSEFYATGRQSRLALSFTGKIPVATLQAYYELDWLGAGITSNNNQSNSYVMRERQLWAQAKFNNGTQVTGGQQWTLATETRNGLDNKTEVLPDTIDPQYNVGFVWARQPSFRVTQNLHDHIWLGLSVEQSQIITPTCQATGTITGTTAATCPGVSPNPTNYLLGTAGTGGGLYNPTATYSYNLAPDVIAKIALQNKYGHFELFGIGSFLRDRVYPLGTPLLSSTGTVVTAANATGAYNNNIFAGGGGGGFRGYAMNKKLEVALHGLYGDGIGRYSSAQLPDTTLRPNGQFAPLHNSAALGEVFLHATPRLDVYTDWGYEEVGRRIFADGGGFEGYGLRTANNAGCGTQPPPGSTAVVYPPAGIGYLPASPSCSGNNKSITEGTIGYDYYFYKGPMGRFRQGFQYSWLERAIWSGSTGTSPKAIENEFETNIRYYLP